MSIKQILCIHKWAALPACMHVTSDMYETYYVCETMRPYVCMKCHKISWNQLDYQNFDSENKAYEYVKQITSKYSDIRPYIEVKDIIEQHKRGIPDICTLQQK